MNKIFNKVPVQIQNRSGFDCSHQNIYTLQCGTLTPSMVDVLIPGDIVSLGHISEVQMPVMATDFYGRVQFKTEVFFCPMRLLYGGFQQFIVQPTNNQSQDLYKTSPVKYLPNFDLPLAYSGRGTLADYLGFKPTREFDGFTINNPLPFIAYQKIYNDWYRDSRIQKELFSPVYVSPSLGVDVISKAYSIPYSTFAGNSPRKIDPILADNSYIYQLRQRCWSKDYFTNSTTNPQAGTPSVLSFNVEDNKGSFTIASLRAANSLQQWMERNNLAGSRYIDQIRAHYGVTPSDAVLDRPVYLGSHSFDIYNKSVYQSSGSAEQTNNPMNSVGSKFASPLGVSDSSLVDSFEAKEFGFLMVICSIVPDALYSTGTRRYLEYRSVSDFANPILSAVGDQAIKNRELCVNDSLGSDELDGTFGYTQRYSEYKFMLDEVHGELRDGGSLSSFAIQRSFDETPQLSSSFLTIPTDYLDQVTAVSGDMSKYGAWVSTYFSYKKSSVLPAYSIPTLGDPKDTHTEIINNGGTRL